MELPVLYSSPGRTSVRSSLWPAQPQTVWREKRISSLGILCDSGHGDVQQGYLP